MTTIKNYRDLLKKIADFKIEKNLDLSSGEDLSIGIMNLISIEEHLFFTFNKTGEEKYLSLLNQIRLMRTQLLKEIIKDYEGEVWCISKHLLAASMRLMEVGTKKLKEGQKGKAKDLFIKAYQLYSLFWGLNLHNSTGLTKTAEENKVNFINEKDGKQSSVNVFAKLGEIVNKALDCCRE